MVYVKPQRDNVGIVLPELMLYAALEDLPTALKQGKYADGDREERIFKGLSEATIRGCFKTLQKKPPTLSLSFPNLREELPSIVVMPESMGEEQKVLGDDGGRIDDDITHVEDETILQPQSGVVAGETVFLFPEKHVDGGSVRESIYIRRSGSDYPLLHVMGDFTVDSVNGSVTLDSPLIAGDELVCYEFMHYTLPGGDVVVSHMNFTNVIFIDTINPLLTHFLVGLVWRHLMVNRVSLQEAWLDSTSISRRFFSLWDTISPAYGFRSELVVSGITEWEAYTRNASPREISFEFNRTYDSTLEYDGTISTVVIDGTTSDDDT